MFAFSYSRINDFAKCPFYFKCRHIDKIAVEEQDILVKGSVIHAILESYTKECYKRGKTNLFSEWQDIAYDVISRMNVLPEYEDEILNDVKTYLETTEIELEGLAGVEERIAIDREFNIVDWTSKDVWFRAIFDKYYLDKDVCKISDFKARSIQALTINLCEFNRFLKFR